VIALFASEVLMLWGTFAGVARRNVFRNLLSIQQELRLETANGFLNNILPFNWLVRPFFTEVTELDSRKRIKRIFPCGNRANQIVEYVQLRNSLSRDNGQPMIQTQPDQNRR
jgi:hypothetical protein